MSLLLQIYLTLSFALYPGPESVRSRGSGFSLGPVNGAEDEFLSEDEDRQAPGSDFVSSTSKWHKHTVKVLSMLKRNMGTSEEAQEGEDTEPKPTYLSYFTLSEGCSRRTAASVFFELLQLKVSTCILCL